jgi:hypothetical protein
LPAGLQCPLPGGVPERPKGTGKSELLRRRADRLRPARSAKVWKDTVSGLCPSRSREALESSSGSVFVSGGRRIAVRSEVRQAPSPIPSAPQTSCLLKSSRAEPARDRLLAGRHRQGGRAPTPARSVTRHTSGRGRRTLGDRDVLPSRTGGTQRGHMLPTLQTKTPLQSLSHKPRFDRGLSSGEARTIDRASSRPEVTGGPELPSL